MRVGMPQSDTRPAGTEKTKKIGSLKRCSKTDNICNERSNGDLLYNAPSDAYGKRSERRYHETEARENTA